jgi:hypothetical protein
VGLERRAFLRLVGVSAGVGLLPTGCAGVPDALAPPATTTLRFLSPRTYAVLSAAAMRIVGPRGAALVADRTIDVGTIADGFLARMPVVAGPVGQALLLLEFAVWPLLGKVRPFTSLGADAQDAILSECMTSRIETKRAIFRGVRSLALVAFYGAPASRALTGFPGPFGNDAVTMADAMRD